MQGCILDGVITTVECVYVVVFVSILFSIECGGVGLLVALLPAWGVIELFD